MALLVAPEAAPIAEDDTGTWRVGGTRVPVETVVGAFLDGGTAEEIVQQYPALDLGDVYAVIAYYLRHREQVEAYLERRHAAATTARAIGESRWPQEGLRARLLARRAQPPVTTSG